MGETQSEGNAKAGEGGETMTQENQVRDALRSAIRQAEQRLAEGETASGQEPTSRAEAAIRKLREDLRLSGEELDRPVTI